MSTSPVRPSLGHIGRIPTPTVVVQAAPEAAVGDWKQPAAYVRRTAWDESDGTQYDADTLDRRWLELRNDRNAPDSSPIPLDLLEAALEWFERLRGASQAPLPPCPESVPLDMPTDQAQELYWWWRKRLYCRVKLAHPYGKPLVPWYEGSPDPSDIQQPFHSREGGERLSVRSQVKLPNMEELRDMTGQLEQLRVILRYVADREACKRENFQVQFGIWHLQRNPDTATFNKHVLRKYGERDPTARSLSGIRDVAQLLELCQRLGLALPRFKVRLQPSPAAAPPVVPRQARPHFGRCGEILWTLRPPSILRPSPLPSSHSTNGPTCSVPTSWPVFTAFSALAGPPSLPPEPDIPLEAKSCRFTAGSLQRRGPQRELEEGEWEWDPETAPPPPKRQFLTNTVIQPARLSWLESIDTCSPSHDVVPPPVQFLQLFPIPPSHIVATPLKTKGQCAIQKCI
jgi:hypothetical protein